MDLHIQGFQLRGNCISEIIGLFGCIIIISVPYLHRCIILPGFASCLRVLYINFLFRILSFHACIIRVVQGIQQVYQESEGKEIFCIKDFCQNFFFGAG